MLVSKPDSKHKPIIKAPTDIFLFVLKLIRFFNFNGSLNQVFSLIITLSKTYMESGKDMWNSYENRGK